MTRARTRERVTPRAIRAAMRQYPELEGRALRASLRASLSEINERALRGLGRKA
jgi:hypothetical protein